MKRKLSVISKDSEKKVISYQLSVKTVSSIQHPVISEKLKTDNFELKTSLKEGINYASNYYH